MGVPHKCPKCEGYGKLLYDPNNPFGGSISTGPWHCNPCGGTGIIWSSDPVIVCKPFRTEQLPADTETY